MKKIILNLLVIGLIVFGLTGCGDSEKEKVEEKKEVSINSAYILDYDDNNYYGYKDQARLVVVFDVKPNKDLLLEGFDFKYNNIAGKDFNSSMLLYDYKEEVKANESVKLAVYFRLEKYLYKDNDTFEITYSVGKQKGEYSYVINDSVTLKKSNIKNVDYLEDIIKGTYSNSNDALMIAVLKKKLWDLEYHGDVYAKFDFYTETNYNCYDNGAKTRGEKVKDYFADGAQYNVSITNIIGHLNGNPELTYELPALNYETLEKYYEGITELLTEYNKVVNKYANGLLKVNKKQPQCYRDTTPIEVRNEGNELRRLLNVKEMQR